MTPAALVVGVGNRTRGDDGVGPEVASRVAALGLPGVRVVVEVEPLALVDHLDTCDVVVIVDAVRPGGHPGRLRVQRLGREPLPRAATSNGTHGLGVLDAVELARVLGRLPHRTTLVGVEALSLRLGAPLSPPVRDRLAEAVRAVMKAAR